jgi:pimeloyl-ACP methyl ester carboxylesterase
MTEANGLIFHTQVLGEGEPVALIHGLIVSNLAEWYFTAAPVIARTRRVLLYDLRGHGRTQRTPRGYDVQTMVADLAALLDAFDPRPVALAGYSFGGLIALQFQRQHPERVSRLALIETPLPPSRAQEADAFSKMTVEQWLDASPESVRRTISQGRRRAERFVNSIRALVGDTSLMEDIAAEQNISDSVLEQVRCPVLCIYGDSSACLETGRRLSRVLPDARLNVIPGGHYLLSEAPHEVVFRLEDFLRG